MSWACGVELDLNEPAEVEKQGAPVRFAWVEQQREPPPEPAIVHDTASFLEEITRVDEERDQADTTRAKRKRDDGAHGAASRAERTIERYYDHRLEEEGSINNKKRRSEGTGGVMKLDSAVSGRHSGFEVVEFQLVCPIASFDIRRKQGDALKAEVERQPVKCRIPPFEMKGSGVGVITADGHAKNIRSPHEMMASGACADLDTGEATFTFPVGFRFNSHVELEFFYHMDIYEPKLCTGELCCPSTMAGALTDTDYYRSCPRYDAIFTDRHRYELRFEDRERKSRAIFKGRILRADPDGSAWADLILRALPIGHTSQPLKRAEEEEEEEEEDEED